MKKTSPQPLSKGEGQYIVPNCRPDAYRDATSAHWCISILAHQQFVLRTLYIVLAFSACRRPPTVPSQPLIDKGSHPMYISCEGNYGWGNGSVSVYNPQTKQVTEDLFFQANGYKAGDVVQSITAFNNKLYLTVNNSGKVMVLDPATFKVLATISGLRSPRYFLGVNAGKAYVSDLYANDVSVVDLNTNTIAKTISLSGWTEGMTLWQGKVYVCNERTDYVYIIDPASDKLTDSVLAAYGSQSLVVDKNNCLWVACVGDTLLGKTGMLVLLQPGTQPKPFSFTVGMGGYTHPHHLCLNPAGDTLYFLNKDIYRMKVETQAPLNPMLWVAAAKRNFYSLGIHPHTGHIYVADAIDYVSKGRAFCLSPTATILDSFRTGITPGGFWGQ